MLVDDDRGERNLFNEAIQTIDPDIVYHAVEDGNKAFELLESITGNLPQVIFVDINMPVMSGWVFLKTIKENKQLNHIPVIMYSTSNYQRDIDIAIELGALCFCIKPESYKLLTKMIQVVSENLHGNLAEAIRHDQTNLHNFRGLK